MEYGALIRQAWTITWHTRFLWVLGILAGGAVGIPALNSAGSGSTAQTSVPANPELTTLIRWFEQYASLVIAIGIGVGALLVILLILSFIAQGGMAQATADLASGHASSLRRAWSSGVRLFWRYVGLWLTLIVVAMSIAAVVGATVAAAVGIGVLWQRPDFTVAMLLVAWLAFVAAVLATSLRLTRAITAPRWAVVVGTILLALPVFPILLGLALTVSIVVAFAQRAIAVEDIGPIDAIRSGWRITRAHFGDSLLTWLVNIGLAIGAAVATAVMLVTALLILGGFGALVFAAAGLSAPTIAYIGIGAGLLLVGVLTLTGMINAFFWTYWTIVYLRFSGRARAA